MTIKEIQEDIEFRIRGLRSSVEEFATKFIADPVHAVEWSEGHMAAVAELHVLEIIAEMIIALIDKDENKEIFDRIQREIEKNVLSLAGEYKRSTSPWSNLMKDEVQRAYARQLGWGGYFRKNW